MKRWQDVYVSSRAFGKRTLKGVLEFALTHGIERTELSSIPEVGGRFLEILEQHRKRGLSFLIHNYFPAAETPFVLNLASACRVVRERSLEHCRRAIEWSRTLGAEFYSVHAGFAFDPQPSELGATLRPAQVQDLEDAYSIFLESVQQLASYAAARGLKLAIENNVLSQNNLIAGKNRLLLMVEAEQMLRLWEDARAPNLGFLMDTGHLKVSARTLGFDDRRCLSMLGEKVMAFHLSENDGFSDQNLPFDSSAWFVPQLVKHRGARMILECRAPMAEIRRTCETVVEAMSRESAH